MADKIPEYSLAVILDTNKKGKAKCKATISKQTPTTFNLDLHITDFKIKIDQNNATDGEIDPPPGNETYGAFPNRNDQVIIDEDIDFDCTFTFRGNKRVVYLFFQSGDVIKTNGIKVRSGDKGRSGN